jgi:hypothetical protein
VEHGRSHWGCGRIHRRIFERASQARSNLAQWRRDRLLTFCVDLVSAGREISRYTNSLTDIRS